VHIRYRVELDESGREHLTALVAGGTRAARRVKRAQILPAADAGVSDAEIAATLRVGTSTVYRISSPGRKRCASRRLMRPASPGWRTRVRWMFGIAQARTLHGGRRVNHSQSLR